MEIIPYQKEKLDNAVCFFAKQHFKHTRNHLHQTFLYKYIALFDFGYLKHFGKPALGLTYRAMTMGPVPLELYDHRDDLSLSSIFSFKRDENKNIIVVPQTVPNLDYFNKRETDLMNRLIEIYGAGYVTSRLMSDASHQEVLAWRRAWSTKQNSIIDFSFEFTDNVFDKSVSELSFPEEVFLINKGIEHCN